MNNQKREGGLVLKTRQLQKILAIPGTLGLAFALKSPGEGVDMRLKVLRVYADRDNLIGEEKSCPYQKGAAGAHRYPSERVGNFQYVFADKLIQDQFYFGFYPKENFELFFQKGWDELFVCGGKQTYPEAIEDGKKEWFTFTMYRRKSLKRIPLKNGNSLPILKTKRFQKNEQITITKVGKKLVAKWEQLQASNGLTSMKSMEVRAVIYEVESAEIKGLLIKEKGRIKVLAFETPKPIIAIALGENNSLKSITQAGFDPNEDYISLGMLPGAVAMIGCPPRWDHGSSAATFRNTVQEAVLVQLNK